MNRLELAVRSFNSYKWFIDALVDIARSNVSANRILEHGHAERRNDADLPLANNEKTRKNFVLGLNVSQRTILVEMLNEARRTAVHDVASFLEDGLSNGKLTIEYSGKPIPASPFATMHYDFVCRFNGDAWPDQSD